MSDTEKQITQFLVENFLFGQVSDLPERTVSLIEAGLIDSTGVLELVAFLEQSLGVTVADDELVPENLDSIDRLVAFVRRKQDPGVTRRAS